MLVILWTDALLLLLLVTLGGYLLYAVRSPQLRRSWREVAQSRAAMASAVVLAAFMAVAVLDSIHFHPSVTAADTDPPAAKRYSAELISALDWVLAPLRQRVEKTYSAPFAAHAFSMESVELEDGRLVRDYPRLRYGGAHLENLADKYSDIALLGLRATLVSLLIWALVFAVVTFAITRRRDDKFLVTAVRVASGRGPWCTVLLTLGVLILAASLGAHLGVKYHLLGTDKVGQDVFYQALKSIRTGVLIGTLTTLVMVPFALGLGITAGYFRGWVDDGVQYVYTTLNSIPGVLLIAAAILMMQVYVANHADDFQSLEERADLRLLFLCVILGITSWTGLCRLLRGEVLKLREVDYIQAAVAFGVGHGTILLRHVLPNVLHIVLITVVLDFSTLVLAEAVLSYVNIGVDPATNSWGNMINGARLEMAREPVVWWSLSAALGFMFTLVLAANLFADAVRDAFDPRVQSTPGE